jgi:glycosyltransferase involved in cell wall biosynthesis
MRILMVSSAPSARCGIANYALQQAAVLRSQGHEVHWASVDGGAEGVEHAFNLERREDDYLQLAAAARRYDRVLLHYQPALYGVNPAPGYDPERMARRNALLEKVLSANPALEVVAHEVPAALLREGEADERVWTSERAKWRAAPRVWFHTQREVELVLAELPELAARVERRIHHQDMVKRRDCSQAQARMELGVPAGARVFLCIGFIQETKGFDRAVQAFAAVPDPDARLYVVGSTREDLPHHRAHLATLQRLATADPRVQVVCRYVDDVAFDTWLIAADVVVLPYREIFSSSVAARAKLFGRRVVAADIGGLVEQLEAGDEPFEGELQLEQAMIRAAAGAPPSPPSGPAEVKGLRLAFVMPWYGDQIPGGAEAAARSTLKRLAEAGAKIEVLTTCIQDYFADWTVNARPRGVSVESGIRVRRFPVEKRAAEEFARVNMKAKLQQPLTAEEQRTFEEEMIRCPELPRWIAAHRADHDFFIFIPYMFATSVQGSAACPGQAIHIPCLHDEGYLDLPQYGRMLREARGVLFNSESERDLAVARFGLSKERHAVPGLGVAADWAGDGAAFRARNGLRDYLLFVGRRDSDKRLPELMSHFRRYRNERAPDLQMVLMGPDPFTADPGDGDSVRDFGFASERDKRDALAGSLALAQPSVLESFSFVMMESWIASRPVLVSADSQVTRGHCAAGGGGLWFRGYAQFAACLDRLRRDRALANALGRAGRRHVLAHYDWPVVIEHYGRAMRAWLEPAGAAYQRAG